MSANRIATCVALGVALCLGAAAQVAQKKSLTLEGARRVLAAAEAEARRLNAPGAVIAVADDGGNLMALHRLDGTFAAGANISIGKARTAALFKRPTKVFEDIIAKGRTSMVALPEITPFTPLQGGVPILVDGQVVGAIGVSGAASAQQDEELAIAGAGALNTAATDGAMSSVSYIESAQVAAAFAKGSPLLEVDGYKIHASRREGPGMAEIHEKDTDIVYVLEGSASFVTGGTVPDPKTIAPEEIRGSAIQGGDTRRIVKGDVIVVPNGTPHWFREVSGPLTYYVVKIRAAEGM